MQELLGVLSIVSSLLVLVVIWATARPVKRSSRMTGYSFSGRRAAVGRLTGPEGERALDAGGTGAEPTERKAEEVRAGESGADAKGSAGAGGEVREGQQGVQGKPSEAPEGAQNPSPEITSEGGSEADLEEEVYRELSETLSLYRQLLEELRRLRSGGPSE